MKIFEISISDETDWVCANNIIQALKFYCDLTGTHIYCFDDTDDIVEVPPEKWKHMDILDTGSYDEQGEHPVEQTFEDFMKTAVRPDIIATTCY